jgi:hypothetical protein
MVRSITLLQDSRENSKSQKIESKKMPMLKQLRPITTYKGKIDMEIQMRDQLDVSLMRSKEVKVKSLRNQDGKS